MRSDQFRHKRVEVRANILIAGAAGDRHQHVDAARAREHGKAGAAFFFQRIVHEACGALRSLVPVGRHIGNWRREGKHRETRAAVFARHGKP